jgi:hypothetical protein
MWRSCQSTAEHLRPREVLCVDQIRRDLRGVSLTSGPPDSPVLLDPEGLRNLQNVAICRNLSPLTDSNRRPPPYHGGFAPLPVISERRLVARFPCNLPGFSARSTLALEDPERPRRAPNLSPEPSPKEVVPVLGWQRTVDLESVIRGTVSAANSPGERPHTTVAGWSPGRSISSRLLGE